MLEKNKKAVTMNRFFSFHIALGVQLEAGKSVVIEIAEWKFKTNIARNSTFEGS